MRFSEDEIARVRAAADSLGLKTTAYIRGAALESGNEAPSRLVSLLHAARADIDSALREARLGA